MSVINKALILPVDLGQGLVNYLQTKPYNEVANFLQALQQLKPAEPRLEDTLPMGSGRVVVDRAEGVPESDGTTVKT